MPAQFPEVRDANQPALLFHRGYQTIWLGSFIWHGMLAFSVFGSLDVEVDYILWANVISEFRVSGRVRKRSPHLNSESPTNTNTRELVNLPLQWVLDCTCVYPEELVPRLVDTLLVSAPRSPASLRPPLHALEEGRRSPIAYVS